MTLKKRFMDRLNGKEVDMTPVGSTPPMESSN